MINSMSCDFCHKQMQCSYYDEIKDENSHIVKQTWECKHCMYFVKVYAQRFRDTLTGGGLE